MTIDTVVCLDGPSPLSRMHETGDRQDGRCTAGSIIKHSTGLRGSGVRDVFTFHLKKFLKIQVVFKDVTNHRLVYDRV